jgi:hypothetical protein
MPVGRPHDVSSGPSAADGTQRRRPSETGASSTRPEAGLPAGALVGVRSTEPTPAQSGGLAPSAAAWRRSNILSLQRLSGNAAVALSVQARTLQREPTAPPATGERAKIDAALEAKTDTGLVKDITDFSAANEDERITLAEILVTNYSLFFGPNDRACLTRIFTSFGGDLFHVADKKPFFFEKCLREWPGLMFDLKPVKDAGDAFKKAISDQAMAHLGENITYLKNERKRMFGVDEGGPQAILDDSRRQKDRAMAMVLIAEKVLRLHRAQKAMLKTDVGFTYNEGNPIFPTETQKFVPNQPPKHHNTTGPSYDSLMTSWDAASMLIGEWAGKFPWLFGLLKDWDNAETRLQGIVDARSDPNAARAQIMSEMQVQISRAESLRDEYMAEAPDWYDLVPVRERLFEQGLNKNFERLVARQVVGSRNDAEWYKKMGLQAVSMGALLVVSFATAGAAPVIAGVLAGAAAVGIPATQAYLAYQKADQMEAANRATVLRETDVVAESQAEALRAEGLAKIIETLITVGFVGADVAGAALFNMELAGVRTAAPPRQAELISRAFKQGMKPVETSTRTGMSLAEMMTRVGPESEAGKLIQREITELAGRPVAELTVEEQGAVRALATKDPLVGESTGAARTLSDPAVAAKLSADSQELIRTWTQLGTKDARLAWCKGRAVELLKQAGIDVEIVVIDAETSGWGSFRSQDWVIRISKARLEDNAASAAVINEITKTIIHEARHAEQFWLMARRLYGRNWSSASIEEALGLRADVIASARRAPKILDGDAQAPAIDFWLKNFETAEARSARSDFLTQRDVWKARAKQFEQDYLTAMKADPPPPLPERRRLLAQQNMAANQFQRYDLMYRQSGIEADAFAVEKGVGVDLAEEEKAKAIHDELFAEWQKLMDRYTARQVEAETQLELMEKAGKPENVLRMRRTDVDEARQIVNDLRAAKPSVN